MDVRPNAAFPKYLGVWLEAPDGTILLPSDAGPGVNLRYFQQATSVYFRVAFPVVAARPGTHAGLWRLWVENLSRRAVTGLSVESSSAFGKKLAEVLARM